MSGISWDGGCDRIPVSSCSPPHPGSEGAHRPGSRRFIRGTTFKPGGTIWRSRFERGSITSRAWIGPRSCCARWNGFPWRKRQRSCEPPLRGWCGAQPRAGLVRCGVLVEGAGVDGTTAIGPKSAVCSPYGSHPSSHGCRRITSSTWLPSWLKSSAGPPTYGQEHGGHPNMIKRHVCRSLTETQRARWMQLPLSARTRLGSRAILSCARHLSRTSSGARDSRSSIRSREPT
jgi:hypothetical protein